MTNDPTATTKKSQSPKPGKSSFSDGTAPWKTKPDALELGKYLVHELGLENGSDTLARWMAHHVAELILTAETADVGSAARADAEHRATETVLRIWEHRRALPGNADPLRRYEKVVSMLERVRPGSSVFHTIDLPTPLRHARSVVDQLSRVAIALVIPALSLPEDAPPEVATESLSEEEQRLLDDLSEWITIAKAQPYEGLADRLEDLLCGADVDVENSMETSSAPQSQAAATAEGNTWATLLSMLDEALKGLATVRDGLASLAEQDAAQPSGRADTETEEPS